MEENLQEKPVKQVKGVDFLQDSDTFNKQYSKPSFVSLNKHLLQDQDIYLEDKLFSYPSLENNKNNILWIIQIQAYTLILYPTTSQSILEQIQISSNNLLGAKATLSKKQDDMHELCIFVFPKVPKSCCNEENRVVSTYRFYHQDIDKLKYWENIILHFSKNPEVLNIGEQIIKDQGLPPFNYKLLVFVNPFGGAGKAANIWQRGRELLQLAGYTFQVIMTERRNHCMDYIRELPLHELQQYAGIVTVSGDGLPHEALNGLFNRQDFDQAKQIPFGSLPGGSGNAFVKTVTARSNEPYSLEGAVYLIAKGQTRMIDIQAVQIESKPEIIYSFLSVNWAFVSDVDLGSEFLRCIGGMRFSVYGTWRAIFQRNYNGKLQYTTESQYQMPPFSEELVQNEQISNNIQQQSEEEKQLEQQQSKWKTIQTNFKYFLMSKMPYISSDCFNAPLSQIDDGFIDMQLLKSDQGYFQMVKFASMFSSGSHFNLDTQSKSEGYNFIYERIKAFRLEPNTQNPGIYSIDGEEYPAAKLQATIKEKQFKVFCF